MSKIQYEQDNEQPNTSNIVKKQKLVKRQYREDYIQYRFFWCDNKDASKAFCREQLVNEAIIPNKLICHLNTQNILFMHARIKIFSSEC